MAYVDIQDEMIVIRRYEGGDISLKASVPSNR